MPGVQGRRFVSRKKKRGEKGLRLLKFEEKDESVAPKQFGRGKLVKPCNSDRGKGGKGQVAPCEKRKGPKRPHIYRRKIL